MDALECIKTRQSIRAFTNQPVERRVLEEVLEAARWAPSYKNTQPWEVVVLTGGKKKALTAMLLELFEKGAPPTPDLPEPGEWPPAEQARIERLYRTRAERLGVDLRDPEVIRKAKKANFAFYNAPVAVYLFQEAVLSQWSLFDLGLFAQSFMLAAHAKGLGSVPQAFATDYAAQTKEFLGIPASKRLVLGLSVGYPDTASPANSLRTDRDPVAAFTRWLE